MTWFRVGGAGIPASLKNAMNAVLNKKFGTSGQNYPPNGWPDDVNLLGPLPEGTSSGSVAVITDGADQVPIKSWNSNVDANANGVSEVSAFRSGKNLIDLSSLVDGYVNSNGTFNTNHTQGEMRSDFIPVLPNTVYYFSIVETTGTADAWVGVGEYTDTNTSSFVKRDGYWRFTTSATTKYVVVSARNLAQATKIQLEIGNDPTTWEEYTPIEQYTVSLGRIIHGGSLELISGAGTDENGVNFTFDPISPIPETEKDCNFWTNVGSSSIVYRRDIDLALQAVSSSRGLMMASRPVTQLVGEESDPDQVNELVENDETEQEGEDNAR